MVVKKPRIVIIGAGMAGLTAANKLHTVGASKDLFELCVVEGGTRIGGRIRTSEFCGDRIEMGATWIHGIGGSPIHNIAQETHSLESDQPWECMDGNPEDPITISEGGFHLSPSIVNAITNLFKNLMDHAQGKLTHGSAKGELQSFFHKMSNNAETEGLSFGSFLRQGLDAYWDSSSKEQEKVKGYGKWSRKLAEEAVFAMHENTQRTHTSASDLFNLDYSAESEYRMFPGEEITIAKGYLSIIEHLASVLPPGVVQLGRKVTKIEWKPQRREETMKVEKKNNGHCFRPVKIHLSDGSVMYADHVIVTVSLGVLKAAVRDDDSGMFDPPLPSFKAEAISRLGFGVVNKLFLQMSQTHDDGDSIDEQHPKMFPFLQLCFNPAHSESRRKNIPWWMRRTATINPIYKNSRVLLCWFAGEEAEALESLKDEEIVSGASHTFSSFLSLSYWQKGCSGSHTLCNGNENSDEKSKGIELKFGKVLKTQWAKDPLFLGSYSYVAVGSSGDDLDTMAEPLPKQSSFNHNEEAPPLQILFAGEATHRTHYSTTHGAYFSGLREANRLLKHYHCTSGIYNN